MSSLAVPPGWAEGWQRSWDRLEASLIPGREWLIAGLIEAVEAVAGVQALVIDLGCGTGTVTLRLLERLPSASVIAVDVDPVLLTVASATFAEDDRVRIVKGDLRDDGWHRNLPAGSVDAVVTMAALHWLSEQAVERLYRELAELIRPGGVFVHAEVMAVVDAPTVQRAWVALVADRLGAKLGSAAATAWEEWWASAAADPRLSDAVARRAEVFEASYPRNEFSPPASWHTDALREAGFTEADVVYRAMSAAIVAAVR